MKTFLHTTVQYNIHTHRYIYIYICSLFLLGLVRCYRYRLYIMLIHPRQREGQEQSLKDDVERIVLSAEHWEGKHRGRL